LAVNLILVVAVVWFVVRNPQSSLSTKRSAVASNVAGSSFTATNPLDQLSSADIAVNVARLTNLPEATAVKNQAESENAQLAVVQASDSLVAKPQVVATAFKSNKDIQSYVAVSGDTVASIAAKFSITSDSVRWSNSLSGNAVTPGQKLLIPPVNGIVYTIKSGDTPASLASKYGTSKEKIIAYNDAELSGLKIGERIIIPGGSIQAAPVSVYSYASSFPWGTGPVYGYNGYDFGYCTWYVASRIAVPSNWGNASSWAYYAALSGWTVSSRPSAGAIAQTPYAAGGEGHVAIVDAVSADGRTVEITDMNGIAGWGRVGTAWEPTSKYPNYISH
jgi:N-acetylmuramoyl-L-alanine amidase